MFDVKQKEISKGPVYHFYETIKNCYEKTKQKVTILITGKYKK